MAEYEVLLERKTSFEELHARVMQIGSWQDFFESNMLCYAVIMFWYARIPTEKNEIADFIRDLLDDDPDADISPEVLAAMSRITPNIFCDWQRVRIALAG